MDSRRIGAAALLVAALVTGCTSTSDEPAQKPSAAASESAGTTVEINTFQFVPKDLEVKVGETVTWVNNDSILHTVTLGTRGEDEQGQPIDVKKDGTLDLQLKEKGDSGSYTFDKPGTYTYFCDRHPGMDAKVTVS